MKKILVLIAIVFSAMQLTAANVDLTTAQQFAQRFLMSQTVQGRFMTSAPTVKWTHEAKSVNAQPAYYIVNTDRGYVIVSGDDRAREVLAYGEGTLESVNDLPEAVQYFLDIYQKQMDYLLAHPGMTPAKFTKNRGISVEPLLQTAWSQGKPYNMKTPRTGYGSDPYCRVGCAAVALAQVMNYWRYPVSSPALPGYTTDSLHYEMPPLDEYTFDYDHLLNTYRTNTDQYSDVQLDAIGYLMLYTGYAMNMDYTPGLSGADYDEIDQAIRTFGFDQGYSIEMKWDYETDEINYTEEEWAQLIQSELIAGRPLVYCAFDMSSDSTAIGGHAFNVDGYDADNDLYHVNFGMSADKNTYYALNAFTLDNGMTVYDFYPLLYAGVQPPTGPVAPRMIVSPTNLNMECYAGETTTATFTVAGLDLTDAITITVNDANGVFTTDVASIAVADAASKTVTVTYAPQAVGTHTATITLSTPGGADATVTLNGTATAAPLVLKDPVMLPADSANITLTSFRADWTDQTPAENVVSYTLQVNTKPNYSILAEADWSGVGQNYNNIASTPEQVMPEGWTFSGNYLWMEGGRISIGTSSSFSTPALDLAEDGKVTVVINANDNGYSYSKFKVSTSMASQDITPASTTTQYVIVLDCAAGDKVTFAQMSGYPGFVSVKVYSGEVEAPQIRAIENGDATYRTITGITDKFYTVTGLTEGGTFIYKVKTLFVDNTWSDWSNVEEVTLVDNGPVHQRGDVNHDGRVSIKDVTDLIDYLLGGSVDICVTCADVNGQEGVTIGDVTTIIDILLGSPQ